MVPTILFPLARTRCSKVFCEELKLARWSNLGKMVVMPFLLLLDCLELYCKNKILICDTFYAIHDCSLFYSSFIGTDQSMQENIIKFKWNDLQSLKKAIAENENQIACILLEVCKFQPLRFIEYLNILRSNSSFDYPDENINTMKFGIKGVMIFSILMLILFVMVKLFPMVILFQCLPVPEN